VRTGGKVLILAAAAGLVGCGAMAATLAWSSGAAVSCGPALEGLPEAGTHAYSLISGGMRRCYLLHIPPDLDRQQPAAIVLSLHGFLSNPRSQAYLSRWHTVADREGFIVVYPQGTGRPLRWNSSLDFQVSAVDDVQFLHQLLTELAAVTAIDPARVYVNGMSNGGAMAHRLACELSDVFAAAGIVAGPPTTPSGGCNPSRPVPIIAFYGTDDPLVAYQGSAEPAGEVPWWAGWMHVRMAGALPAVEPWIVAWAERNGCAAQAEPLPAKGAVSGICYGGCAGGAEVILYTVAGGGHTWPGGGPIYVGWTTNDISATEVMWDFFEAHPLTD